MICFLHIPHIYLKSPLSKFTTHCGLTIQKVCPPLRPCVCVFEGVRGWGSPLQTHLHNSSSGVYLGAAVSLVDPAVEVLQKSSGLLIVRHSNNIISKTKRKDGREELHANGAIWTNNCLTKQHESAGLWQEVPPPATFLPGRAAAPPKDNAGSSLCVHYDSSSSVYHRVPGHPLEDNQRLLAPALEAPAGTFSSDA